MGWRVAGLDNTLKCQCKQVVSGTPLSMKTNLLIHISAPRVGRWLLRCPEGRLYDLRAFRMFVVAKPLVPFNVSSIFNEEPGGTV